MDDDMKCLTVKLYFIRGKREKREKGGKREQTVKCQSLHNKSNTQRKRSWTRVKGKGRQMNSFVLIVLNKALFSTEDDCWEITIELEGRVARETKERMKYNRHWNESWRQTEWESKDLSRDDERKTLGNWVKRKSQKWFAQTAHHHHHHRLQRQWSQDEEKGRKEDIIFHLKMKALSS